jgi:hypothetical protein
MFDRKRKCDMRLVLTYYRFAWRWRVICLSRKSLAARYNVFEFSFVCTLRISCYAVRHYVIWCASKELRELFWECLVQKLWNVAKTLPDTLPSFDVLVLETDWMRRLRLPAVSTGYSSLNLLVRKFWENFTFFLILGRLVLFQIL